MSSTPAAQAVIANVEAHYRAIVAAHAHVTISMIGTSAIKYPSPPRTGDLTFQNLGMLSFMEDGLGFEHVALEGTHYRSSMVFAGVPLFEDYDRSDSVCSNNPWSHIASILVGPTSIGTRFDFTTVSTASRTILLWLAPLPDSLWTSARFEVDSTTFELKNAKFVYKDGGGFNIDIDPFVRIPPPGHAAFMLKRP